MSSIPSDKIQNTLYVCTPHHFLMSVLLQILMFCDLLSNVLVDCSWYKCYATKILYDLEACKVPEMMA